MFTGKLFRLSSFSGEATFEIQRDCEFAFVGKVPTKISPRLVACGKPAHIKEALGEEGICGMLVPEDIAHLVPENVGLAVCASPMKALLAIQEKLASSVSGQWEHFESRIHPSAKIMAGAVVAPQNVIIEEGVVVHPNAVICERTIIGKNSSIGPGTIVGADAFEVDTTASPYRIVPQSGGVRIGSHVDVQAKCTVVRSTFGGFTELGDETKFDCQVHFAHDCRTGRRVQIAACAEISGRVDIEDDVFIGPNASITNGCTIGKGAFVTIGAVVTRDVPEGGHVTGNFAIDHKKWLKFISSIR